MRLSELHVAVLHALYIIGAQWREKQAYNMRREPHEKRDQLHARPAIARA